MKKFINKFATHAEYAAAKSGLILPNVSLCAEEREVHYNPTHDYVEIGGTKWATMNVGAISISDFGLYFQWSDTQGYTAAQVGVDRVFNLENAKYYSNNDYTKYNDTDGKTVLDAEDDAVTVSWGGNWRMPTIGEYLALMAAVNTAWTQVNGVYGMQCTDKTNSSKVLFFPAAGHAEISLHEVGVYGRYCTSTRYDDYYGVLDFAFWCSTYFDSDIIDREYGFSVRGVLDEN